MSGLVKAVGSVLSVEYFAAKGWPGVVMMAPCKCGLNQADTLRVDGLLISAVRNKSILPIELPSVNEGVREKLMGLSARGERLPVGEFMALGLFDYYSLAIVII